MNCILLRSAQLLKGKENRPISMVQQIISKQYSSGDIVEPVDTFFTIPRPIQRDNESLEQKKNRLQYQSRKRGMLENDLLLGTFAAKYLKGFNEEDANVYDRLINGPSNDWDLYYWATGIKPIPEEFQSKIMDLLVEHCKNINKESRIRQPNLY